MYWISNDDKMSVNSTSIPKFDEKRMYLLKMCLLIDKKLAKLEKNGAMDRQASDFKVANSVAALATLAKLYLWRHQS